MSIALIAPNNVALTDVAGYLRQEGVDVCLINLAAITRKGEVDEAIDLAFLILGEQELIKVGESTSWVRKVLGEHRQFILCVPLPGERATLIELGANEIISPILQAASNVAERIFAQLILMRRVRPHSSGVIHGAVRVMRQLYHHIQTLAPLDEPVLILGETGTGKELVAHELHKQSGRRDDVVAINCAELNPELLGSELFGHEKGAFTNAIQSRKGLIAEAGKGTVFLDEIGDLDLQSQAKLLRVIEEKKVRPVGSNHWEEVHARVVLATNRNLDEDCQTGRFRVDLLERIRGFTIELPPLRTRKADIPLLVEHFVADYNQSYKSNLKVPSGACDSLFRYSWPGNIRELRSAVRKAAAYADENSFISSLILQEFTRGRKVHKPMNSIEFDPSVDTWRDIQKLSQEAYFKAILAESKGSKEVAIKLSGLSKSQFYEKLKDCGLM